MFLKFFSFEIKYWLKQPMVYIFFFINALLIFAAIATDGVTLGGDDNIYKNAPAAIQSIYGIMSIMTLLMTTAFVNATTSRDFEYKFNQILFSMPINRLHYLFGKFLGAIVIALIPLVGVSIGMIIGTWMPWVDADKLMPNTLYPHVISFCTFAVPNVVFIASVIFAIASTFRNSTYTFTGALVLITGYILASNLARDLDNKTIVALIDPFGFQPLGIITKYWTVAEQNTKVVGFEGLLLYNRLLWLAISALILTVVSFRFSFTEKVAKKKEKNIVADKESTKTIAEINQLKSSVKTNGIKLHLSQLRFLTRYEVVNIVKNPTFIIIMLVALLNLIPNLFSATSLYGLTKYPVTYNMVDLIDASFGTYMTVVITIFSGLIMWRARDNSFDEITDATPYSVVVMYISKFLGIVSLIVMLYLLAIAACVVTQAAYGYTNFELALYFKALLGVDLLKNCFWIILSMFIHTLVKNKYTGFFLFVAFIVVNRMIWGKLFDVESNMVQVGSLPSYIYSDMNGFGPYVQSMFWFGLYWTLFFVLIAIKTVLLWSRGKEIQLSKRINLARINFTGVVKSASILFLVAWLAVGSFVFYNTKVLNKIDSEDESEMQTAEYEKLYKRYEKMPQPKIIDVKYTIDLFPESRELSVKIDYWLKNKSAVTIDTLFMVFPERMNGKLIMEHSKLVKEDKDKNVYIYKLYKPILPGDSVPMKFAGHYIPKGFENEVGNTQIVYNGSFFNHGDISPSIGYQFDAELQNKHDRKKYGLKERARMPVLTRNCTDKCMNTYISNDADWVNVSTVFSTSADQTAIAPGSLQKKWTSSGRNYFSYKLDKASLNFYSFISARYEIAREKYKGIDLEVYYDKKHPYNIEKMLRSMRKSLDYYITNYGPYYHKQTRILEFPQYASFAQAFPGTMPYSEGIGFIARIEKPEDIDMVFYVVAHEMAHQWWAHQVCGPRMQGSVMLSETFAQYSALMVMEKEYGRDKMRKFLRYELDKYLAGRRHEDVKEVPLLKVENQPYIHYQKGSIVMYHLKERIGATAINNALHSLIDSFAYKNPPYPNAYYALDAFKKVTPDSLQYFITDLFETITLFDNRITAAKVTKQANGTYKLDVTLNCTKFKADSLGNEKQVAINDWLEIAVYKNTETELSNPIVEQKIKVNKEEQTITLITKEKPAKVILDPLHIMIDRINDDNEKVIKL